MKIKLLSAFGVWLYFTVFCLNSKAQTTPTIPAAGVEITKAIPASADAAALGKYGSIPVSPYTGVPNISIPLYTVKSGDLSLPISLSYHAGGIKVEEMASSVGLGWTLNAGGAITRTIKGMPDEDPTGYLMQPANVSTINTLLQIGQRTQAQSDQLNLLLNEVSDGSIDGEPDVYNFNFGGYSGKFVMDANGNAFTIPLQNIKFTIDLSYSPTAHINSFTAKTPDGVSYYFGSPSATEYTNLSANQKHLAMSWFLYKVVSPTFHEIDLTYVPEFYHVTQVPTQTLYQFMGVINDPNLGQTALPTPANQDNDQLTSNVTNTVKLHSITFENGSLTVAADSGRYDVNPDGNPTGARLINAISVNSPGLSKIFRFYYLNNSTTRLRLDSLIGQLEPIAGTANFKKEKYSFSYSPDPWKNSSNYLLNFSQDWWGYYNGQGNVVNGKGTLAPGSSILNPYNGGNKLTMPGANRAPDENAMMGGILTSIQYPTGGYSAFSYEANQEFNVDLHGTSSKYPKTTYQTALSNDPGSIYYNYDINNGNLNNTVAIYAPGSNDSIPINIHARGLRGPNGPPPPPDVDFIAANIFNSAGVNIYNITNTDTTIWLTPDTYQIRVIDNKAQGYDAVNNPYGIKYEIAASFAGNTQSQVLAMQNNYIAGGVRIQQIADYDGINPKPFNVKTYKYLLTGTTKSSGILDFQPVYNYELDIETPAATGPLGAIVYKSYAYYVRTSVSNYPLATTQGSVVGYSHVEEYIGGSGQNGKNEYFYTNSQTDPDLQQATGTGFPFSPAAVVDWRRGLLTKETTWKQTGGGAYAKVQEKAMNYTHYSANNYVGIKVGFNPKPSDYAQSTSYYPNPPNGQTAKLIAGNYNGITDFTALSSETTNVYDMADPTKVVQTVSTYQYDPATYQLNQLQTLNSKNELITQKVTYPNNYSSFGTPTGSLAGVQNLQNEGIFTYPIEEVTQKSNADGTNLRTIKAVLTTYKTGQPLRDAVYELRSVAPVTGFVNSFAGTNDINKDSHYQPVISFDKYDSYGDIVQEEKVGDALHCYIWGYYNGTNIPSYPVAEVINADANSIAYTNFESYLNSAGGAGNWMYNNSATTTDATAPMGAQCYTVSSTNTIVKSGLSSAVSYVVSLWGKTGAAISISGGTVTAIFTGVAKSGWQYHEYKVNGATTVTVGGTGLIDELRLYPVNAMMSTYTYIPLVGMSSKCDTRNNITYYNFDNVGRLTSVMDQNRNYLKDYLYNYVSFDPTWIDNGNTSCVQGPYGNTGEQLMQQTDNNPFSATHGQTRYHSLGVTGNCALPPGMYVALTVTGITTGVVKGYTQHYTSYEADVYSDQACTQRYHVVSDLPVNFTIVTTTTYDDGTPTATITNNYTVTVPYGASSAVMGTFDVSGCSSSGGPVACSTSVVAIAPGTGYTPGNNNQQ